MGKTLSKRFFDAIGKRAISRRNFCDGLFFTLCARSYRFCFSGFRRRNNSFRYFHTYTLSPEKKLRTIAKHGYSLMLYNVWSEPADVPRSCDKKQRRNACAFFRTRGGAYVRRSEATLAESRSERAHS